MLALINYTLTKFRAKWIKIEKPFPPKRLDVGLVPSSVPEQTLVAQTPRALLLPKHIHKCVHVQPGQKIKF